MVSRLQWVVVFGVALATFWAAVPSLRAAEKALTADVEVFYPIPPVKPRGGGVAALNGATMERLDAPKGARAMLRLAGENGPVQGAWWFPGHVPLTPEQALIGDANARLVLEIESAQPVKTIVGLQWRVEGEPADWVRSGTLEFGPDKPTRVELPVPPLKDGAKLTGLILSFDAAGDYHIRRLALARLAPALIDPIEPGLLRSAPAVKITGQTAGDADEVIVRFVPESNSAKPDAQTVEKTVPVRDGRFELTAEAKGLMPAIAYTVTARPKGSEMASPAQRLFVFPTLTGERAAPVSRQGADLMRDGKRFGFVGSNYTSFYLGLSIRPNYEMIAEDIVQMHSWGIRAARVSIDFGMIQPELGVTADDPRYGELMQKHGLTPEFVEQLDYFVALAGQMGIYTIIDWHGMALDPYRYFLGGNETEKKAGKPGSGIAYLAPNDRERGEFDLANPKHVEALLHAHRWAARHFKGNSNILGIEVPFNEPHTKYMAIEANWRRVTDQCAQVINEIDPARLTFMLQPSYSHNNLLPSATWLKLDRVSGAGPHFYQANGPIPTRPDAKSMREPWLARESEGTFGWAFPSIMMPYTAVDYPIYNGETGAHGATMVLPDRSPAEATSLLIEAQLFQEYASGMVGRLEWTMWRNPNGFTPFIDVYQSLFTRYAKVFDAGPRDRTQAEVLFVQHPAAVPTSNGYNFAAIPFAKAALDLHLPPVHYMTDDQFLYTAAAELSVGLEQVVEAASDLRYKAVIADRRSLDPRAVKMIEGLKIPVLWLEKAEDLTADQLETFLQKAGVASDRKTPRELQLADGPEHLLVYRRLDGGANPARAYPQLRREGSFQLMDEQGKTVFTGDAAALAERGVEIDLPLWRSAIYRIVAE